MYPLLALFNGLLIAFMILFNGLLAQYTSTYFSLVIINTLSLATMVILLMIKRVPLKPILQLPKFLFFAGLIGLLNIFLTNTTFLHLGATLSMGLTLYGQLIAALIIDYGGFFGLKKQPFHPKKLIGIGLMSAGIIIMVMY